MSTAVGGCGVLRYEAEGFDCTIDWLQAQPQALVDAICDRVPLPNDGWYDLMAACDDYAHVECEADEGHAGPHQFPDTIVLGEPIHGERQP